jgi:hypothetical protein
MVKRHFWLKKIAEGLQKRSVLWLSGRKETGSDLLIDIF